MREIAAAGRSDGIDGNVAVSGTAAGTLAALDGTEVDPRIQRQRAVDRHAPPSMSTPGPTPAMPWTPSAGTTSSTSRSSEAGRRPWREHAREVDVGRRPAGCEFIPRRNGRPTPHEWLPDRAETVAPDSRVWPLANVWGPRMKRCVWASPHPATGSRVEDRHDDGKVRPPTALSCRAPWPCARRRSCAHWSRGVRRAGSARNAGMRLQRKHGANRTRRQHFTHVRWRHVMASRAASCPSPRCYLQALSEIRTVIASLRDLLHCMPLDQTITWASHNCNF